MKLRQKINILVIGLTVFTILVSSGISYFFSKEMIKDQVDNYLQAELSKNAYDINGWINTQSQIVITISDIVHNSYEKNQINSNLLQSYMTNSNISDIYIGFTDGKFISGNGWKPSASYDPRERSWYQEAMEAGKLNISNVYFDLSSNQNAISIGIPLQDKNDKIIGVLGVDILLETFYEKIENIELKESGYAFLLDENGEIIIHRDSSLIGERISDLVEGNLTFAEFTETTGMEEYSYQGVSKLVVFDKLDNTDWTLALVVEKDKAYMPLNNLLLQYGVIVFLTLIFAVIITKIFNGGIVSRLRKLSDASILLSRGEFETKLTDNSRDEIGDVSRAFQRMQNEIYERISQLNLSNNKYEELVENTIDAIYSVDSSGYLITANSVLLNIFHIRRDEMFNKPFKELVVGFELGILLSVLQEEAINKNELISREVNEVNDYSYNVTVCPIRELKTGESKGATVILHDLSDIRQYQKELEWIVHHDSLTLLPNRYKLSEDIESLFLKSKIKKKKFAIVFVDIDDFKNINDTLGYATGDLLLKKVGEILQDEYKTYRIGADEFVVIVEQFTSLGNLEEKVENLFCQLNCNITLNLNTIYNSVTMGVSIYPNDFADAHEMMVRTDAALNCAKKQKRSSVQYYEESISLDLEKKVVMENGIRNALDNDEFILYYQPIMDKTSNSIKGFEALIRWKNAEGKIISPGIFMPIAENMALIHEIGFWVIRRALEDLKYLQDNFNPEFTMAINLSVNQIKLTDFAEKALEIVKQSKVKPEYIFFEITESILIDSMDLAQKQLYHLSNFGTKISLDDFGTGYSSLNYLQHFPINILKIDKSFVDYVNYETAARSLVKHIISIAHWLDIEIVAEGVENEFQKKYLLENQCDYFQGYLFYKPMPMEQILHSLKESE